MEPDNAIAKVEIVEGSFVEQAPIEFKPWPKIPRLRRNVIVTEKLDGTNACVVVTDDGRVYCQSRTRLITPEHDNYGFAKWVKAHEAELQALGPGHHFGEWWGKGIQRGYNQIEKRFSLFNTARWANPSRPECCGVVPILYQGLMLGQEFEDAIHIEKSVAAPGYPFPEGVVVFHPQSGTMFKFTVDGDGHKEALIPDQVGPKIQRDTLLVQGA